MTKRAAIYVRQSLNHAEGIERGLARTRGLVTSREWALDERHVYIDDGTSASRSRAGARWAEMLKAARRGEFDVVVGVDMDRLVRSLADMVTLMDIGLPVVTVDGEIDLTTADGEFRATMLAGLARFEVRRKSERQKRGNEHRASLGVPVPGRRRYGYEGDNMTPRETEARVVRWAYAMLIRYGSVRRIWRELERLEVPATTGTQWSVRRVREMLLNPSYAGFMTHRGETVPSDHIVPLVTVERFERVKALLTAAKRRTTPGPTPRHLASGLASCGVCGATMFYMRAYRCRQDSSHPSIIKSRLDSAVRAAVVNAFLFGERREFERRIDVDVVAVTAELEKVEATRASYLNLIDDGTLSAADARPRLAALNETETALRARLDEFTLRSASGSMLAALRSEVLRPGRVSLDDVAEVRQRIEEHFDALDLERQRELVRSLVRITVFPGREPSRVHVDHLVATSLNEDASVA